MVIACNDIGGNVDGSICSNVLSSVLILKFGVLCHCVNFDVLKFRVFHFFSILLKNGPIKMCRINNVAMKIKCTRK